jgi:CheY-like chemotaxis protein
MGLGLAVVFGTVSAHGGRVWVERAPAGGARFVIELPVASAVEGVEAPTSPAAPAPEATSLPTRGTGQRILIVDDEEPVRVLTSQVLANFGYAPTTASSATEALALLEQGPFDAILTDVRMPGMDGIELYREVERRWPELASQVVIMTGDVENEAVANLLRESGLASLEKPFRLEQLLSTLAAAVGARTAER